MPRGKLIHLKNLKSKILYHTHKKFWNAKIDIIWCTEDIYKFVSLSYQLHNEAGILINEILPEKADISLLKFSLCISLSANCIQVNLLVGGGGGEGPVGVIVQISKETVF